MTISRRRGDAGDPVAASPFVERLRSALAEVRTPDGAPGDLRAWRDPRGKRGLVAEPVRPTAPTVPADALPARLSASAFEALRACPYRFFAERVLHLSEPDELDDEVEKRDYGTWLHDVLAVFHRERSEPRAARADEARLREIGESVRAEMGIDAAAFLPYDASFAGFVPRYVEVAARPRAPGLALAERRKRGAPGAARAGRPGAARLHRSHRPSRGQGRRDDRADRLQDRQRGEAEGERCATRSRTRSSRFMPRSSATTRRSPRAISPSIARAA